MKNNYIWVLKQARSKQNETTIRLICELDLNQELNMDVHSPHYIYKIQMIDLSNCKYIWKDISKDHTYLSFELALFDFTKLMS